jgi:hypothetical protein
MDVVEQLLSPGCDVPACRCGKEMYRASKDSAPEENRTHIRIYKCRACQHEMHLTVWSPDASIWHRVTEASLRYKISRPRFAASYLTGRRDPERSESGSNGKVPALVYCAAARLTGARQTAGMEERYIRKDRRSTFRRAGHLFRYSHDAVTLGLVRGFPGNPASP